jgi:hypothetical protein
MTKPTVKAAASTGLVKVEKKIAMAVTTASSARIRNAATAIIGSVAGASQALAISGGVSAA